MRTKLEELVRPILSRGQVVLEQAKTNSQKVPTATRPMTYLSFRLRNWRFDFFIAKRPLL